MGPLNTRAYKNGLTMILCPPMGIIEKKERENRKRDRGET
jgi:hypothetical protein